MGQLTMLSDLRSHTLYLVTFKTRTGGLAEAMGLLA